MKRVILKIEGMTCSACSSGLEKNLNKQDLKQYAGLPGISFVLLFFCSMTSYLFPIHNWVDQNCFLTLGKGILEGTVPYRDLFEQ